MIRIGILIHKNQYKFLQCSYLINELMKHWGHKGYKICILKGTKHRPPLDLLINHVDLTTLPPEYCHLIKHYPNVVNGKILDISKRKVSKQLLNKNSDYQGSVIVKLNQNSSGIPEIAHSIPNGAILLRKEIHEVKKATNHIVFPSIKSVPEKYLFNEKYVIEKYLPEMEGKMFYLRVCIFFGDNYVCAKVGSRSGVIKGQNVVSRELVEAPKSLIATLKEMGFDYGKVDFGIHNGEIVIYDTNRTPGHSSNNVQNALLLADGIDGFFE